MVRDISRMAICLKKVTLSGSVLAGEAIGYFRDEADIKSSPCRNSRKYVRVMSSTEI